MDDLSGLSWTPTPSNEPKKPPPMSSTSLFSDMRRNDNSGRSTPLSTSSGRSNTSSKTTTPAGDSFANLVSFGSSNPSSKNLSLAEQQKRLQEERAKKEADHKTRLDTQYGAQNNHFWDSLEKGGNHEPALATAPTHLLQTSHSPDEDDILAAFDAAAPVDASTHFPVPSHSPSPQIGMTPSQSVSNGAAPPAPQNSMSVLNDDDPFGLGQMQSKPAPAPALPAQDDEDDFLGDLSKPVSEFSRPERPVKSPPPPEPETTRAPSPKPSSRADRAVAELVDMGFPADKASQALSTTRSGTDVQAAVGWLLTQAHEESRQKTGGGRARPGRRPDDMERSRERSVRRDREVPSWAREERLQASRSPAYADKDPSQTAANFGNNILKTANSLWKTGNKKLQQVVQDMNAEHDPNQPRWMREAAAHEAQPPLSHPRARHEPSNPPQEKQGSFTDEALLLETGGAPARPPRPSHNPYQQDAPRPTPSNSDILDKASPARQRREQAPPAFRQQQQQAQTRNDPRESKSRLNKLAVEEQSAQQYVSPARRKRPTPQPPAPEPAVDLFESSAPSSASRPTPKPSSSPAPPSRAPTTPSALPTRPKAPPRTIPPVSQEALTSANRHRSKAAEAYKRGDYAAAHESFAITLTMLPEKHPITIVIRSNRAMTASKIGDPKSAISDADAILELIGPSKGEGEQIDPGNGEPSKNMREFFGKALMRKAEAQEQLERWTDAAKTWRLAVETGHGGGTSIQGRNRCEKAAGISKPTPEPSVPAKKPPAPKKASALDDLTGNTASASGNSAAVSKLREANQAAERADEEKFALSESVDARLSAWRNGKQDNLRALLGSLDTVLWPEAGWKKANMSELIMPNKVKINYMKGIGKVHPDKVFLFLFS